MNFHQRAKRAFKTAIENIKEIIESPNPVETLNNNVLAWEPRKGELLLSWGSPADGFIYQFNAVGEPTSVKYYYAEWFKVKYIELTGDDFQLLYRLYTEILSE